MRQLMADRDFRTTFTRRRPTTVIAHEGESTQAYDEERLVGIVQPPKPEDTKLLPEGTRVDATRVFWSATEMRGGDGQNFESDVLIHEGEYFRVLGTSVRRANGFWRVVATGFNP